MPDIRVRRWWKLEEEGVSDVVAPTVTITCTQSSPSSASPLNFTFTLSEASMDFTINSITAGKGTKSNFAGSGVSYTCDLAPDYSGSATMDVAGGAFHDAAGNGNTAATQFVMVVFAAAISPTIGATIVTDGDMESGVVTTFPAVNSPTTREKSGTQKHGGAQSLHIITDAVAEGAQQIETALANTWHHINAWGYVVSGDLRIKGAFAFANIYKLFSAASWVELFGSDVTLNATNPRIQFVSDLVAISEFYTDDVYVKPLTMATCFATPRTGGALDTVSAKVTSIDLHKIGVVANLDSISAPLNYVLAVVDKYSSRAWLYQISNGVYAAKINAAAITYVDDKLIEIRHTAATTYQLWYNGAQVGADQTINDAAINNNTLYAQFSTYAGNTFTSFM